MVLGVTRCLEAIRKYSHNTKFLQASTSELFGDAPAPQNEKTPFKPRSPYAIGKLAGFASVVNYREAYNIFASNAISFNHEGVRRGETFVTRKITKGLCECKLGLSETLYLGNIKSKRDFSDARDICKGMYMIIDADEPDDYILASGESHSIEEFLDLVGAKLDIDWKQYVKFDDRLMRPTEVPHLHGDYSKIKNKLGWTPAISFSDLVSEMVDNDLKLAKEKLQSISG